MARRVLGEGRFLRLVDEEGWEFTERVGASGVVVLVPMTDAQELVLVEQYRPALKHRVLELPAGLVGDKSGLEGEAFESAAARELEEETGFRAASLRLLCSGPSSSGSSNVLIHFYAAESLTRVGPGGGDEHEEIQVHVVPLSGLAAFIASREAEGCLIDFKIYSGLHFLGKP